MGMSIYTTSYRIVFAKAVYVLNQKYQFIC